MRKQAKLLANFLGATSAINKLDLAVDTAKGNPTDALILGRALGCDLLDLIREKSATVSAAREIKQ
jgi:hypothetical protein